MSVSLATQNPEAHARLAENAPLPGLGDTVLYHLRPGEMRAGKNVVAADVLGVDQANQRLKLLIKYDAMDMLTLDNVPRRMGDDQGWEPRPNSDAALRDEVAGLRQQVADMFDNIEKFKEELADVLFGQNVKSETSFEDRLQAVEALLRDAAPGKKGRG